LNLYSVENRIVVDDIIGGSPAERWGFKNGDILISVDNNLTNTLQQYKNVLQSATNKIKVIIARNGVLKTVYFKAGRIF
jgi:S1-C subfamily serine protease